MLTSHQSGGKNTQPSNGTLSKPYAEPFSRRKRVY